MAAPLYFGYVVSLFVLCFSLITSADIRDVFSCWEQRCCRDIRTDILPNLNLTYSCSNAGNVNIILPPNTNWTSGLGLFHSSPCITNLPENICDYPNIVSLKIVNSSIGSISRLSYLKNLMALDLSNNKIELLKNNTFTGMTMLRYIDLRYNRISYIEPHTFKEDLRELMTVSLDGNRLITAEPWPMSVKHPFCHFGLSFNKIRLFTNEENWHVDLSQSYGPGYVDFSNNNLTIWIVEQVKIYGFNDLRDLGKLMALQFDIRNNPWRCDCKMHPFLKLASNFPAIITREYFEVYCESPAHLKRRLLTKVPLEAFVCNITNKCPSECFCQDQPERGQLVVDCREARLTRLPLDLPHGLLKLLFSNNFITTLEARPYLDRTRYMDLSNNSLVLIAPYAVLLLQNMAEFVNISHNRLQRLPKDIQNFQTSKLDLNDNLFICDCKSTWMSNWVKHSSRNNKISDIKCSTPYESNVMMMQADDTYLRCHVGSTVVSVVLAILAVFFIIAIVMLIIFRYEVMVLIHIILKKLRGIQSMKYEALDHDILISVDEDSEDDRMWTSLTLLPELEQNHHLRVYYPPRDMDPGSVTVHEFIATLKKSRTVVIVLSDNYVRNSTTMFQFREAYNVMVRQRRGKLIIVRYTNVKKASNGYLNAFIRLKKCLENDEKDLFPKIANSVRHEISTSARSQIHTRI